MAFLLVGFYTLRSSVLPFLAITDVVESEYIVVEGWVSDEQLIQVVGALRSGQCTKILTVGGPLQSGGRLCGYTNYADLSAATLRSLGAPAEAVVSIPVEKVDRDRTYKAALAVRAWLEARGWPTRSINLYSEGAHARRSRYLFELALEPEIEVGVIAGGISNPRKLEWWRTSDGTKKVFYECIAFVYTRLFFRR